MCLILNIETATKNCSVSIALNGELIKSKETAELGFSHAEKLHVFIEEVLKESNLSLNQLNAIAVSKGPGSYTGLRIGVSAAKGLCFGLDIPLIATDTLKALALQVKNNNGIIIPMIDARRMEVFTAIFDANYNKLKDTEAVILDEDSFKDINQKIYIVGDSSEKCKTILSNKNVEYLEDIIYPSAKEMCKLSFDKFINNDFENLAYFEPFYLKDFYIANKN